MEPRASVLPMNYADHHYEACSEQVLVTWSEMVNFMAVTTVVRLSAEGEDKAERNSGSRRWGSIRQSLPRHSATTFRVPEKNGRSLMTSRKFLHTLSRMGKLCHTYKHGQFIKLLLSPES